MGKVLSPGFLHRCQWILAKVSTHRVSSSFAESPRPSYQFKSHLLPSQTCPHPLSDPCTTSRAGPDETVLPLRQDHHGELAHGAQRQESDVPLSCTVLRIQGTPKQAKALLVCCTVWGWKDPSLHPRGQSPWDLQTIHHGTTLRGAPS
jgi:hypothetical protein